LFGAVAVNAGQAKICSPQWDYPTDTWRLHPDSLVVNGSSVLIRWHIDDIYIPGSPDASSDLEGKVSIQVDVGPMITGEILQQANVTTKRLTQITNLAHGRHTITVSMDGEYFLTCVEIPSHNTIVRWYGPGESIPIH
jgi:hypothetical protein